MVKLEKEIKILDIDVDDAVRRLNKMEAKFVSNKFQKIYTYDIPTIYYRFLEVVELLKIDNKVMEDVQVKKLKVLLDEFMDLISDDDLVIIYDEMNINDFNDLYKLEKSKLLKVLDDSRTFNALIKNELINPNKWVRLRQSNDKVELTVKHIYYKNNENIEKVFEYEINTNNFEDTNKLLEAIGLIRRNYQEKKRISYEYKNAQIEIDLWPIINPYIEIECDDEAIMNEVLEKLDYNDKEIISINTADLYRRININVSDIPELKFNQELDK